MWHFAPEILLAGLAVVLYAAGALVAARGRWAWVAASGLIAAGAILAVQDQIGPAGPLVNDALACWGRWFALLVGLGLALVAARTRLVAEPEYSCSLLLAVVGTMLVAAASNLVLLLAGFSFGLAAVPFHFHVPKVRRRETYTGAALLAIMPAAAGSMALARLLGTILPAAAPAVCWLAMLLAALGTMLGNVMVLRQDHLGRLLAYSSIAQGGYLFVALSVAAASAGEPMQWDGLASLFFYLVAYALATLGTFAALVYLARSDEQIKYVDELAGLGRTHPAVAAALAVCLLSLAGMAPLAGCWGKVAVLVGVIEVAAGPLGSEAMVRGWFIALAALVMLGTAVAAAYYVRIVGVIYFRLPRRVLSAQGGRAARAVVVVCALSTVGIGLCGGPLWRLALEASRSVTAEEKKGTDTFCLKGPPGATHKRCLFPFSPRSPIEP